MSGVVASRGRSAPASGSAMTYGLTAPFELSPSWYAQYLKSDDPDKEFGIPVHKIGPDLPALANPQPGFIVIIDRVAWASARGRKEQRRAEGEDGISWLSSSSTRPCVITLPSGQKLVTEYLYRRDRALAEESVRSLQKHEIWLLDSSYMLINGSTNGKSASPNARLNSRRPTMPMPSRCLVHYIDKKHAVWHCAPPRVVRVPQPASVYTRPSELLLTSQSLTPFVGASRAANQDAIRDQEPSVELADLADLAARRVAMFRPISMGYMSPPPPMPISFLNRSVESPCGTSDGLGTSAGLVRRVAAQRPSSAAYSTYARVLCFTPPLSLANASPRSATPVQCKQEPTPTHLVHDDDILGALMSFEGSS